MDLDGFIYYQKLSASAVLAEVAAGAFESSVNAGMTQELVAARKLEKAQHQTRDSFLLSKISNESLLPTSSFARQLVAKK